ncbi:murein biosynthesis integral membrane protein MurJ [Desulfosudis oleivorans]|uniref:Probable lipid II flippase MurJ n=1 Tax=Desulfosudis oleivorans (strain DSM 6200 / JCM 39069 / Hxd3) TaxID=96561 RepID=A8ZV41_DESOH|nr:murein biosynthesis integral membrane protein MurJ [Desulfosudis oleivorans]ABW68131.1 integral membrane protein MviN [Desulfosudis oleivorans Hxd3]
MDEKRRVTRATGIIGSATLLSRVFGYARDMALAAFLGAGMASDAFFVAFRIPNLLRRLFAEGSLTIAFVPVFLEQIQHQGREEAFAMARSALRLLSVILVGVTLLGILFSPEIVYVMGFGFADVPEKFDLTVSLTRIMFPYVFFVCLVALAMGILNALGHFAAPALAPVLLNIAMLAALWAVAMVTDDPALRAMGLAWGVIAGGVLQLALQVPFLTRQGLFFWQKARLYHPALKKVGMLMLPAVFGAAVYQVNIVIGTLLATLLPEGSVSYLYYADRLVQFPLGVFAISAAMAVLPSISRQAAAGDFDAVKDTFGYSMRMILFISFPSMAGLIVLREPIVALLFERGGFDAQATRLTADALFYYVAGLWAFSAVRIVVSTFYALSDTKTPVVMAVIAICINAALSLILMGPLAHGGLALATSIASMVNLLLLTRALAARLGHIGLTGILRSATKSALCAALMGLAVWLALPFLIPAGAGSVRLLAGTVACMVLGVVCFVVFAYILKSRELGSLVAGKRSKARDTVVEK